MQISSVGIVGFGAFGKLAARFLCPHFQIFVHDKCDAAFNDLNFSMIKNADIGTVARCDFVVLAVPVDAMHEALANIRPHLRPGTIVFDVGSVKTRPALAMMSELPNFVEIVGTHPLFGPQSAQSGISGLKIAICPIRTTHFRRIAAFLRKTLRLKVVVVTPEEHDLETAVSQGLIHLIARVLTQMEPLPNRLNTVSFDLLLRAVEMVRYDSSAVFLAIQQSNPYAPIIRSKFIDYIRELHAILEDDVPAGIESSALQLALPHKRGMASH